MSDIFAGHRRWAPPYGRVRLSVFHTSHRGETVAPGRPTYSSVAKGTGVAPKNPRRSRRRPLEGYPTLDNREVTLVPDPSLGLN
jgi:hypothetical protein